jgi:SAM-dependent methyltransferase
MHMDDLSRHNRERWNALASAGVEFSRPWLDLDQATARARVDPLGLLGDVAGKRVLCLAGGGGQQSVAFRLLGADATVFDLSDEMLERDRAAAAHYKIDIRTIQGDVRDLSALADASFDVVWHAHSLTFVPDLNPVYDGVSRVLRLGGIYHVSAWNPLAYGADARWTGEGYLLQGYIEGAESVSNEGFWDFVDGDGQTRQVAGPREFQHTLTALVNGLIQRGFVLLDLHEEPVGSTSATPGSWDHFCSVVPPWISIWAVKRPELLNRP